MPESQETQHFELMSEPTDLSLKHYALKGDGATSTVVVEVTNGTGAVVYKGSLSVTTTAKSFDVFLAAATPAGTFVNSMKSVRIYSVSGAAVLINTSGNGDASTNNGVTSGFEPVSGQAYRIPIGTYTSQYVGFGEDF